MEDKNTMVHRRTKMSREVEKKKAHMKYRSARTNKTAKFSDKNKFETRGLDVIHEVW
jgi:hypothetical protein